MHVGHTYKWNHDIEILHYKRNWQEAEHKPAVWEAVKRANPVWGCIRSNTVSKAHEVIILFYLELVNPHLKYWGTIFPDGYLQVWEISEQVNKDDIGVWGHML